jgi:hypothetical protein
MFFLSILWVALKTQKFQKKPLTPQKQIIDFNIITISKGDQFTWVEVAN